MWLDFKFFVIFALDNLGMREEKLKEVKVNIWFEFWNFHPEGTLKQNSEGFSPHKTHSIDPTCKITINIVFK